jgi:hypothetical protein
MTADLKAQSGVSPVRDWRTYLEGEGYTVKNRDASANITDRHIVLYTANDGTIQATLSDSQAANSVKPIGRMTITKSTKAGDSKGAEYIRGAGTAKAIVNATAAFAIGNGFEAQVDGADQIAVHQAAQERLKDWIEDHDSEIFELAKFAYRDGDGFLLIRDDGSVEDLDPDTVDIQYDPLTGLLLGYDITETTEEDTRTITYIRQFRTISVKYLRLEAGQTLKDAQVLYEAVYTEDGLFFPTGEDGAKLPQDVIEMPLPVIHCANEPEALYGNSELQNVLIFYKDYNDVLEGGVKNDVYNNTPIPYFTGISKPPEDLGKDSAIAIPDATGKAGYLTTDKTADNSGTLLEYIFYNIVQASETPEFLLGTAVASSKASVSEQIPVIVAKARRKRKALKQVLRRLIDAYVFRQVMAGDPDFFRLWQGKVPITISFPPIVDEDEKLTMETIKMLLDKGIISDETALELSVVGPRIHDKKAEVEQAHKDAEAASDRSNIFPDEPNRPQEELDALEGGEGGGQGN